MDIQVWSVNPTVDKDRSVDIWVTCWRVDGRLEKVSKYDLESV
jgi:hypothetical protein